MNGKKVAFHHFGCKVNFSEASEISRSFRDKGYVLVDHHEKADVFVISTCVVTAMAEKKCRAAIRHAHHLNPTARIAVIGCFSELNATEIRQMEGVTLVLGNNEKFDLLNIMETLPPESENVSKILIPHSLSSKHTFSADNSHFTSFISTYSYGDRTRSFLKIQDGCDYFCAYCTIPLARGHSRSDSIDHVIYRIKEIHNLGVREIVLTGVNIGDFGRNNHETLYQLLDKLSGMKDIPRIRFSSIEPDLLTDEIIEKVAASQTLMPHFHIPLQSGSNRVLGAMKRKYVKEHYQDRVLKIRSLMPLACIATDVIVGFPGERTRDFDETVSFIESLPISYMHVFPYSLRRNTMAAGLVETVTAKEIKNRSIILHQLSDRKKKDFYRQNLGRTAQVLFESNNNDNQMFGFSENYCKVKTRFSPDLINKVRSVALDCLESDFLFTITS